ncbi:YopX family protein [Cloacibacillus sp. An23]|uniref:YopX family protein n=1 Tax=Cloacibacillus sp. An23 TaxID=1965591 RepID=UPI000B376563|nr:YopX family protein [Cloacibacillus sp. An23]OUO94778.1 hypothetical protein B5F39_02605 [Cloacibacillus sp. An23]
MREIKFRGKDAENGEWVYGDLCTLRAKDGEVTVNRLYKHEVSGLHVVISTPVDPTTVGQYTGLKDKNGVEVYEGDILSRNNAQFPMRGPVKYENGGFYFHDEESGFCQYLLPDIAKRGVLKELEVVGNIHDDAGLLNN